MPIVDIKNIGKVQFPDTWSPDQIHEASSKLFLRANPPGGMMPNGVPAGVPRPQVNMQQSLLGNAYSVAQSGRREDYNNPGPITNPKGAAAAGMPNDEGGFTGAVDNIAAGGVKQVANMGIGADNLIRKGMNAAGASYPMLNTLPLNNGYQKAGAMAANTASYLMLPELEGAGLAARMGYGALTGGFMDAIQRGGALDKGTALAAGFGGLMPAASDALVAGAQRYIPRWLNKGMVVTRADMAAGKNPGLAALENHIVANSYEDLAQQAKGLAKNEGAAIDRTLLQPQNMAKRVNLAPHVDDVDNLIDSVRNGGRAGIASDLSNVRQVMTHDLVPDPNSTINGSMWVPRAPTNEGFLNVTPFRANQMKRGIDDMTSFGSSPTAMETGNLMQSGLRGSLNDSIVQQVPEVAPLNRNWRNLRSLQTAASRRAEFAERAGKKSFGSVMAGTAGFASGAIAGAGAGYKEDGLSGAITGGLAGGIGLGLSSMLYGAHTDPYVLTHAAAGIPYVNPFMQFTRAAVLGAGGVPSQPNPADNHGTNFLRNPFAPQP